MPTEIVLSHRPSAMAAFQTAAPEDLLNHFLESLGKRTRREYEAALRHFARFLISRIGGDPPSAIASFLEGGPGVANRAVLAYNSAMRDEEKLQTATRALRLSAIRSFLRYCRLEDRIAWTIDVRSDKVRPYRDTRGPSPSEWKSMVATARTEAADGNSIAVRDLAIVLVMRNLGLRAFELVGIDLGHIEFDGDEAGVWIAGKGRIDRERMTVPPRSAASLKTWLQIRGDHPGPVFHNLDPGENTRLTVRSLERIIPELAIRAGINRRVTPHGLRHNAITTGLDLTGGNKRKVQRFSRHVRGETLDKYDDNREDFGGEIARLIDQD